VKGGYEWKRVYGRGIIILLVLEEGSLGFRGQWPEFLKREGRRTFPEKRSCIFLCKNLIKKEVHRLPMY
jgi:hypothetical protein